MSLELEQQYPDLSHLPQESRRVNYRVNVKLSQKDIKGDLFNVCNQLVYRYQGHSPAILTADQVPNTFHYESLTGGITNRLFVCRYEACINHTRYVFAPLLVRLFGPHTDSVIDRTIELKVAKFISRNNVGPLVLGSFLNGRLEGFLEGARSLTPQQLLDKSISCSVAQAVAMLHKLPYKSNPPPAQDAAALRDCVTPAAGEEPPASRHRSLWVTIASWLAQARAARPHFAHNPERLRVYDSLHVDALEREVAELRSILESLEEPVVFCHNDLLSGNILLVPADGERREGPVGICVQPADEERKQDANTGSAVPLAVTLIDFEYGAPNSRAFDIANHFCECCGFDCDWACFPDAAHQRAFIRAYLRAYESEDMPGSPQLQGGAEAVAAGDALFEARVENLRRRVLGFVLAAHVFWATWAVVMAVAATIDFDYLSYAGLRLRGYYFMKQRALLALQPLLAARAADAHLRNTLARAVDPSLPVVPASIGAAVIGWGAAGRDIHAPLLAAAEGVVLRGAVVRPHQTDNDAVGAATAPLTLDGDESAYSAEYIARARTAQQHMADLNLYFGSTGVCVDADGVARAEADQCSPGPAEPFTRSALSADAQATWTARRERQWALQTAELADYEARVLRAGVDWRGNPIVPAVMQHLRTRKTPTAASTDGSVNGLALRTDALAPEAETAVAAALAALSLPRQPTAPVVYPSAAAALADPNVHLIVIATPPDAHVPIALAAIAAGKHVVVDKPFAPTRAEAEAIFAAARAAQHPLLASCFQNRRWDGDFASLYSLVHNGLAPSSYNYAHYSRLAAQQPQLAPLAALHAALAPRAGAALEPGVCSATLGRVRWAELSFQKGISTKPWKLAPLEQAGGRIWDLGAHSVDQALLLFKPHLPARVHANVLRDLHGCPAADSHAQLRITFTDGSVAVIDCGALVTTPKPRVLLVGDRASLSWDGVDPQEATLAAGRPASSALQSAGSTNCTCELCASLQAASPARVVPRSETFAHPLRAATLHAAEGTLPISVGARTDAHKVVALQPAAEGSIAVFGSGRWTNYYAQTVARCMSLEALRAGTGVASAAVCENPVDPLDTVLATAVIEAALESARSGESVAIKY